MEEKKSPEETVKANPVAVVEAAKELEAALDQLNTIEHVAKERDIDPDDLDIPAYKVRAIIEDLMNIIKWRCKEYAEACDEVAKKRREEQ